jgi:uncharacterized protein YcaQ
VKASLTVSEARRIALAAQGFDGRDRSAKVNWTQMKRQLESLHLLQIDSVNVLCRSHYLPLYSRLGVYDRGALDARSLKDSNRSLFECWAHEASLVRMELHPLMRWRMERARRGDGTYKAMDQFGKENRSYLRDLLKFIEGHGPVAQSDLPQQHKGEGGWWGWSKNKLALETLFDQGLLTTARRDGFERIYDLAERVIPANVLDLPTPDESDCMRQLIELSSIALGIASEFDLRDYFRLPVGDSAKAVRENIEAGVLLPVQVDGWKKLAYVHRDAKVPRKASANALVSPFDPICWYRDRAERLFDFHYRIELYTPAPKRKFGYYVLPFLHGEQFGGRVCLKADRQNATLMVNACHIEAGRNADETCEVLAVELRRLAKWLELPSVTIINRGNLARHLQSALR